MKIPVDDKVLKRIYKLLESHSISDPYVERELEKALSIRENKPVVKLKSNKKLGNESPKRRKANRERRKIVQQLREQVNGCQFPHQNTPIRCFGALEPHEPLTRGRGGSITDPNNILMLCHNSHQWVTTHPVEAKELEMVKNSWESN